MLPACAGNKSDRRLELHSGNKSDHIMTGKRHSKQPARRAQTPNGRRLKVWAEHRESVDTDRLAAVLVVLALRRVEEEAEQVEAEHD